MQNWCESFSELPTALQAVLERLGRIQWRKFLDQPVSDLHIARRFSSSCNRSLTSLRTRSGAQRILLAGGSTLFPVIGDTVSYFRAGRNDRSNIARGVGASCAAFVSFVFVQRRTAHYHSDYQKNRVVLLTAIGRLALEGNSRSCLEQLRLALEESSQMGYCGWTTSAFSTHRWRESTPGYGGACPYYNGPSLRWRHAGVGIALGTRNHGIAGFAKGHLGHVLFTWGADGSCYFASTCGTN